MNMKSVLAGVSVGLNLLLLVMLGGLTQHIERETDRFQELIVDRNETIERQETQIALLQEHRIEAAQKRQRLYNLVHEKRNAVELLQARLDHAESTRKRVEHYLQVKYELDAGSASTLAGHFAEARQQAEARYGVELDLPVLVALSHTESRFRARAVSSAGALGIMQVMPQYHVHRFDFLESREDLFVPHLNVRAGVFIFAEALKKYGSVREAIRAYHGGAGGVVNPKPSTVAYERTIYARLKELMVRQI